MKEKVATIALMDLEYTPLFLRMANLFNLKPSLEANIVVMALLYDNLVANYYMGKSFPSGFD